MVYEPVRVMVANRLSQFGSQWARYFEQHNSGTYNNMWMVVDYKKLDEEEIPTEGVLTVLEQLPHMVVIHDETKTLLTQVRFVQCFRRENSKYLFRDTGNPTIGRIIRKPTNYPANRKKLKNMENGFPTMKPRGQKSLIEINTKSKI